MHLELLVIIWPLLAISTIYLDIRFARINKSSQAKNHSTKSTPASPRQQRRHLIDKINSSVKDYPVRILLLLILNLGIITVGIVGGNYLFFEQPHIIEISGIDNDIWTDPEKPITISYDRFFDTSKANFDITPEIKGEWRSSSYIPWFPFKSKLEFIPAETSLPGQEVQVYVAGITSLSRQRQTGDLYLELMTPENELPETNTYEISTSELPRIKVENIGKNLDHHRFTLISDPPLEWGQEINGADVVFTAQQPPKYDTTYSLELFSELVQKDVLTGEIIKATDKKILIADRFSTPNLPTYIESFSPFTQPPKPQETIYLQLKEMYSEAELQNLIEQIKYDPEIISSIRAIDGRKIAFDLAGNIDQDQIHKLGVPKDLVHSDGHDLTHGDGQLLTPNDGQDLTHIDRQALIRTEGQVSYFPLYFQTLTPLEVISISPNPAEMDVSIDSPIEITFNQDLDTNLLSKKSSKSLNPDSQLIRFNPSTSGTFEIDGQKLTFKPDSNWNYATAYKFFLNPEIKSIWGTYISKENAKTSITNSHPLARFKTQPQEYSLDVPLIRQDLQYECNITATAMVLNYYDIELTKEDLYQILPKDPTPYDESGHIWGDPQQGFVGDISGKTKGYGIYWEPVAKIVSDYREVEIKKGWNIQGIISEINEGHPVILWWQNGRSTPDELYWTTPDGKEIKGVNGMHSEVVIGYQGPKANPTHIIVNDPWRGRRSIAIENFQALWAYFNETALLVK